MRSWFSRERRREKKNMWGWRHLQPISAGGSGDGWRQRSELRIKGTVRGFFFYFIFFLKETRSKGVELLGRVMQEETDINNQRSSERISMFLIFCHDTQLLQSRSLCLLRQAHCVNKAWIVFSIFEQGMKITWNHINNTIFLPISQFIYIIFWGPLF